MAGDDSNGSPPPNLEGSDASLAAGWARLHRAQLIAIAPLLVGIVGLAAAGNWSRLPGTGSKTTTTTPNVTVTVIVTGVPTVTKTVTAKPTVTVTETVLATPTVTVTATPTVTKTVLVGPTVTETVTATPTVTVTSPPPTPRPGLSSSAGAFIKSFAGQIVGQIPAVVGAALTEKARTVGELRAFLLEHVAAPFAEELAKEAGKRIADLAADYLTHDDKAADATGRLRVCVALAEQLQEQIASDMTAGRYGPVGSADDIKVTSGEVADRLAGGLCGTLVGAPAKGGQKPADQAGGDVLTDLGPVIHKVAVGPSPKPCVDDSGSGKAEFYVVRPGDTLWRIAAQRLAPGSRHQTVDQLWRRLYEENRHIVGNNPNVIHVGQRLKLAAKKHVRSQGCPP
jgi:nucleoid-associated protein YgaU